MKLLINKDLDWAVSFGNTPNETRQYQEYLQSLEEVAKRMSVHSSFEVKPLSAHVRIYAQNVTLDEVAMNELFDSLLTELFVLELQYAPLGGAGCAFAMEVGRVTPRAS